MLTKFYDIDRMFGVMDLLNSRMNRMFLDFDRSYGGDSTWHAVDNVPRTNLYDVGDHLEVKAEVAGVSSGDLNVKIQGNYIEISGSKKTDTPDGYSAQRVERGATSFSRSFTLPSDVDVDKVKASLKDGILTLTLPKVEAAKPRQITIH